ncbi:hypothetical protein A2773_03030 [Candidatus Gottesmanbacteria bacterium RIFCSPHIGHO2_01_FULL_39_10]|uniref:VOC domain-containing protein n=1 Tax=Candidatus Gottesmanbacteria bacterium RIFCSPHIGHO2_01_FULL_39_10 TaxID=1798375 RepID=A0A1F5ZKX1_9BACT|nr:MAG: hypothetical protein A2773_03030 [Candidatus Gottesmanbacteria bacterium RIFCSPHIGHO2_01_FULL_39_10]
MNSLGVHIKVRDFGKSRAFYQSLGFKPVFSYGPDQQVIEDYSGVVYEINGAHLEIASGHRAVKPEVFAQPVASSKISLMLKVNSLKPIVSRCTKFHIPIAVNPRHYYWGTLEMVIKDPDGTVLVFIAPYSPEEAKALKADESMSTPPKQKGIN